MKLPNPPFSLFAVVLFVLLTACVNSEKKQEESDETTQKTTNEPSLALPQQGDYKNLFALDSQCKLTKEEIATLYGITTDKIKETYSQADTDGGYYCSFNLSLNNGTTTVFGLTSFKMPKDQVVGQISKWVTGSYEKQFVQKSNSGDHYIWKHPNQGYYMLLNPAYANGIKLQYRMILKMEETQKKYLEEKGIEVLDYLIKKYQN